MARIAVITHEFDKYESRRGLLRRRESPYMLAGILAVLERKGHKVKVLRGLSTPPDADVAVLHIDATVVPKGYVDYAARFPFCVNGAAPDISKRRLSTVNLEAGDAWGGRVIVKSNLNHEGIPEIEMNQRARRVGWPEPFPEVTVRTPYTIYEGMADVPPEAFTRDDLIVEKFVPEIEPDGFGVRFWVFFGERERCTRHVSPHILVKGNDVIRSEPVPVPEELRALRRQLGIDYGKFDFVVHEGKGVLLDANKTPGQARNISAMIAAGNANLAEGFEGLIRSAGR